MGFHEARRVTVAITLQFVSPQAASESNNMRLMPCTICIRFHLRIPCSWYVWRVDSLLLPLVCETDSRPTTGNTHTDHELERLLLLLQAHLLTQDAVILLVDAVELRELHVIRGKNLGHALLDPPRHRLAQVVTLELNLFIRALFLIRALEQVHHIRGDANLLPKLGLSQVELSRRSVLILVIGLSEIHNTALSMRLAPSSLSLASRSVVALQKLYFSSSRDHYKLSSIQNTANNSGNIELKPDSSPQNPFALLGNSLWPEVKPTNTTQAFSSLASSNSWPMVISFMSIFSTLFSPKFRASSSSFEANSSACQ